MLYYSPERANAVRAKTRKNILTAVRTDCCYMGLFYCHCKEQRDLCIIHCTLPIHLFNAPYGIYAYMRVQLFARYKILVYNFNSYIKLGN